MLLRAAAVPSTEAREHLAAAVESAVVPGQGVTPLPADRLHVVVAQFGNLPSEEVPRLKSALAEEVPLMGPGPTLRMAGGAVTDERSYRVVLARLTGDEELLAQLARDVGVVAAISRIYVDRRRFQPALAVAEVDPAGPAEATNRLLSTLEAYDGPAWTLEGLSLMRGTWAGAEKAAGPLYEEFEYFSF